MSLLARWLRLGTYVSFVGLGLVLVAARTAHARATKAMLAVAEIVPTDLGDGATAITIDGIDMSLRAERVDASLDDVLAGAERACAAELGIFMLRDRRADRGVVTCFAPGERVSDVEALARLERFATTHDLHDLGALRYVTARTVEGGTWVTAIRADGAVPLDAMFPEHGDARGEDPPRAPRPDRARRVVSARAGAAATATSGVFVYATDDAPLFALDAYDRSARARGFERIDVTTDPCTRAYRSGLVDVLVTTRAREHGATLSIVESHHAEARAPR